MLSKFFKSKPKTTKHTNAFTLFNSDGSVAFKGTPEQAIRDLAYKEEHKELAFDYAYLQRVMANEGDAKVDLLQTIDRLEAENSRLGNAMFEILKQDTPSGNSTVKRIMGIAKTAVFK